MSNDDDGMGFLKQKRAEAQALVEMQAVAQMQADLAQTVSSRMKTIDSLLTDGLSSSTSSDAQPTDLAMVTRDDDEVNIWKKKIAELSAPICGSVSENTSRNGRHSAPELVHSPLAQKSQNADIQRLAKSSPNNENATGCSINHAKTPSTLPMQPGTKSNRDGARTSPPKPPAAITNSTRQPSSPSAPDSQTLPSQSHSPLKAVDLAPSAQLSGRLGGPLPDQSSRVDAEVDYWRRKIAELSAPSDRFADGGFHSTSLPASLSPSMPRGQEQPPLTRLNLSRPKYKTESLADEPLSWEGTASFADENHCPEKLPPQRASSAKVEEKGDDEDYGEVFVIQKKGS